jgi:hypothetical protein
VQLAGRLGDYSQLQPNAKQAAYGLVCRLGHLCFVMDEPEQQLRELFTQIGCIMEDTSVKALIWEKASDQLATEKLVAIEEAVNELEIITDKIRLSLR